MVHAKFTEYNLMFLLSSFIQYINLVLLIPDAVYLCILKSKHMLSHTIGCLICYRVKIYRYMFIWGGACAINMLFIIIIIFGLFFVIKKVKVISLFLLENVFFFFFLKAFITIILLLFLLEWKWQNILYKKNSLFWIWLWEISIY